MTKSLMISIQPKHLVNILNGYKTLELRKTVPKDFKGWVNIYCTKGKPYLYKGYKLDGADFIIRNFASPSYEALNGKVVARFWFDEYDIYYFNNYQNDYRLINKSRERLMDATIPYKKLCLTIVSIYDYGKGKILYTWNIKNLEIFDAPLSLSDFGIEKAPKSWRYVYVMEEEQQ